MRYHKFLLPALLLFLVVAVPAFAAVEIYNVSVSSYVPAFIDYTLNCQADVTIDIFPSDIQGNPTGPAVKTVTFIGQSRGFHRYIWLADTNSGASAPMGNYFPRITANANQAQWGPITGLYTVDDWSHEYAPRPLPTTSGIEGFYGIAVNSYPLTGRYYGRIYAAHKTQKDVFMYGPDGKYLGKFDDSQIAWGTSAPWDVTVADDGYVYVCDRSNMVIHCFDPDGRYVSTSPVTTNHRAIFARTAADGRTYIAYSGSTNIKRIWVAADHTTWQAIPVGGDTLFTCAGSGDYGLWMTQDLNTIYVAAIGGSGAGANGTTKWICTAGAWAQAAGFVKRPTSSADVSLVDVPGSSSDYLWITRMVGYANDNPTTTLDETARAVYKTDSLTNSTVSYLPYDVVSWGLMNSNDGVGNVAITFGKATASWGQWYWGLFADAGTSTAQKSVHTFYYEPGMPPVVVPGSAVWTPDNTIAADNADSASVSFKVMDIDGWQDITSVRLDLRPLGYGSAEPCTLAPDPSDPSGKTAIATKTGIKAKVGTRCSTSYGQPAHSLTIFAADAEQNTSTDDSELKLNVTGDPHFDAYIKHRRMTDWFINGAQMTAVGGGIPGATDPRAKGPFTYTSAPTDASGYASLEMSAGTFQVKAAKLGFGSESPITVSVPYLGYTADLYLRPLTIAEVRDETIIPSGTKVNVEGVCYAQPAGYDRTGPAPILNSYGLAPRIDTGITRSQWYACDPNEPLQGMLFMITAPDDMFVPQWDDPLGADMFGNSTYIGARPVEGQTIMVTGTIASPAGHERRVLIQDIDITAALDRANTNLDPMKLYPVYYNRGYLGGLPAPSVQPLTYFSHPRTTGLAESWGDFIETHEATVVRISADGIEPGVSGPPVPYVLVADMAGHTAQIAYDTPQTTGAPLPTLGSTYNFTGAAGRRTVWGAGALRVRKTSDVLFLYDNYDESQPAAGPDAVRTATDGQSVKMSGMVVAKIGGSMWLEKADRAVGVRVMANPDYVAVGDTVTVCGSFSLQDGEMVVVPNLPVVATGPTGGTPPDAFDLRSKDIGGAGSGVCPGVSDARGALNVGLKVRYSGMVTAVGADWYYLWDGANTGEGAPVSDGSGIGVRIEAAPPQGVIAWKDWVDVTGMVSTRDLGGSIAPTLVPISAAKVTAFNTVNASAGTAVKAGWNLIGLPAAPSGVSDGSEFSAKPWDASVVLAPGQDPNKIDGRMYRWENCSGSMYLWDKWSEVGNHGPFGGLLLGDGYWLTVGEPWEVSYSGRNSTLDQWVGACSPGWMILGHPKDHATNLNDVKVHDGSGIYSMYDAVVTNTWVDCIGFWWDNQAQSLVDIGIDDCFCSTNTLQPWHGYWLQLNRGGISLIVPESPAAP